MIYVLVIKSEMLCSLKHSILINKLCVLINMLVLFMKN